MIGVRLRRSRRRSTPIRRRTYTQPSPRRPRRLRRRLRAPQAQLLTVKRRILRSAALKTAVLVGKRQPLLRNTTKVNRTPAKRLLADSREARRLPAAVKSPLGDTRVLTRLPPKVATPPAKRVGPLRKAMARYSVTLSQVSKLDLRELHCVRRRQRREVMFAQGSTASLQSPRQKPKSTEVC